MVMRALRDHYISDRNYLIIYIYDFFKPAALAVLNLFVSGWLFSRGLELHWIILFHAFNFAFMGLASPFGVKCANRWGIFKTEMLSNVLLFASALCIALVEKSLWFALPGVLLGGLAEGIVNPMHDIIEAVYIKDHNRGRSYTLAAIITSFSLILSVALCGWLIVTFSFYGIAAFAAVFLVLSALPLILLEERIRGTAPVPLVKLYKQPLEKQFRPYMLAFMGEQFAIIGRMVFIPLILYLATRDFQVMAAITVLAIMVEFTLLLAFGHWLDRSAGKYPMPLRWASGANALALVFYGFFATTPASLFLAGAGHRLSDNLFMSGFRTRVHRYIRVAKPSLLVFGAGWQMSLCFWEFIFLSLFALAACVFGVQSLGWMMAICAAGTFFAYGQARKLKTPADG